MNLNKVLFAGNLTRDPEVRYTPKGTAVLQFSLATNRKWRTEAKEDRQETTFLDCTAWGNYAESMAKYLTKGSNVFIEGRLTNETWNDKETGAKRSKMVCVIDDWQFGSSRRDAGDAPSHEEPPAERPAASGPRSQSAAALRRNPAPPPEDVGTATEGMGDDDIPF